jgi:2-iminobutanoate/2-iminopropanoate deaminase
MGSDPHFPHRLGQELPMPHLTPVIVEGPFAFVSGTLPLGPGGRLQEGGIEDQTRLTLENIEAVLKSVGLSRSDIVKTTVWLIDAADFRGFDTAYAEFFGDHRPARSTTVAALVLPGARIEIEAIARRSGSQAPG